MDDFIFWRYATPVGIRLEQVSGQPVVFSAKVWQQMAYQIWCENGKDNYRDVGHFPSGAPFLYNSDSRISISHTPGLFVAAYLPKTPEADLSTFSERTALGVDTEAINRQQAQKTCERFLNPEELKLIDKSSVKDCVLAFTIKEALYKAALWAEADFREDLVIKKFPKIDSSENPEEPFNDSFLGDAIIKRDSKEFPMKLYSRAEENFIITLAFSPKCAKYKKG